MAGIKTLHVNKFSILNLLAKTKLITYINNSKRKYFHFRGMSPTALNLAYFTDIIK